MRFFAPTSVFVAALHTTASLSVSAGAPVSAAVLSPAVPSHVEPEPEQHTQVHPPRYIHCVSYKYRQLWHIQYLARDSLKGVHTMPFNCTLYIVA